LEVSLKGRKAMENESKWFSNWEEACGG